MSALASQGITVQAKSHRVAKAWTFFLLVFFNAAFLYQMFVLPVLIHGKVHSWLMWTIIPLCIANSTLWALIHEAIHGHIVENRRLNYMLGRFLGVCFGSPFIALRTGHNLHHRFNRTEGDRTEIQVINDSHDKGFSAYLNYYFTLLCGAIFFMESIVPLMAFLPASYLRKRFLGRMKPRTIEHTLMSFLLQPKKLNELRLDTLVIWVVYAISFKIFKSGHHVGVFMAIIGVRAFMISFVDNIYHYGAPVGADRFQGYNLHLPTSVSNLMLAYNFHGMHHVYPSLAWWDLRARFHRDNGAYDAPYMMAAVRQLRGPVFVDEEEWNIAYAGEGTSGIDLSE